MSYPCFCNMALIGWMPMLQSVLVLVLVLLLLVLLTIRFTSC